MACETEPRMTVASELRRVGLAWWRIESSEARRVFDGAIISLELVAEDWLSLGDIAPDVMSEAIEAAEALGL